MLEKVGVRQRLGAFLLVAGLAVAALQSASADGRAHLFVQAQDLKNGVRRLNDGRSMPYLGLGVFRVPPGEPTYNAVKTALKLGYRHIDTADAYHNEEAVGKAVKDSGIPREKIWITTKLPFGGSGKDYDFTLAALRTSLSKLGMDYVDLYLIHNPFDKDYRLEQWRALMEAQRLGLAKSIGVSDYKVPALQEIVTAKVPPAVLQIEISPWLKEYRAAELALCEKYGIVVEAWGAMKAGLPGGKRQDDPKVLEVASHSARDDGPSVLLKWSLQTGLVPLITSTSEKHQSSNLAVAQGYADGSWKLSSSEMATLDSLDMPDCKTANTCKSWLGSMPMDLAGE